jgi:hypothetical protein
MENLNVSIPQFNLSVVLETLSATSRLIDWEEDSEFLIEQFKDRFVLGDDDNYHTESIKLYEWLVEMEKTLLDKTLFKFVKDGVLDLGINEDGEFVFTEAKGVD